VTDVQDLQAVAADTAAGEIAHAAHGELPLGTPCPNCATPLAGRWCHDCGQKGADYHRSIWHLVVEAFEGLTHFDGRFWTSARELLFNPGRLTRDFLDGHRAAQIPPFRLFLVVLLLVFFTGQLSFQGNDFEFKLTPAEAFIADTPAERAAFGEAIEALKAKPSARWLIEAGEHAVKDPEALFRAMEHWSHQFAILLLPIAALLLGPLFIFRRGVYLFDHLIFSTHSLSFQGLLLSTVFLLDLVTPWSFLLMLLAPVHLFRHMRGTYGTSRMGTLIRMFLLFTGSVAGFVFLRATRLPDFFAEDHHRRNTEREEKERGKAEFPVDPHDDHDAGYHRDRGFHQIAGDRGKGILCHACIVQHPGDQLARFRGAEEGHRLPHDVLEELVADVAEHAQADPRHAVGIKVGENTAQDHCGRDEQADPEDALKGRRWSIRRHRGSGVRGGNSKCSHSAAARQDFVAYRLHHPGEHAVHQAGKDSEKQPQRQPLLVRLEVNGQPHIRLPKFPDELREG